jgi:hypothetical protein
MNLSRAAHDDTVFATNSAFRSPHADGYTVQTLSGKVRIALLVRL